MVTYIDTYLNRANSSNACHRGVLAWSGGRNARFPAPYKDAVVYVGQQM